MPWQRSILWSIATLMLACESQYQENWGRLKPGMTQSQVEDLLGTPSSRYEPRSEHGQVIVDRARWQYGDNLSSLATGAMFPEQPHPHAWVVYFDERGQVSGFRAGDWAQSE